MRRVRLIPDWKRVAKKAWSVRLLFAASVLSGGEAALPFVSEMFSRSTFALLTFVVVGLALLARFVAQKEVEDD